MSLHETFAIKNEIADVEIFQRALEEKLRDASFTEDLIHDLSLVSEEVLVNIISYGFESHTEHAITVVLEVDEQKIVSLEFRDRGLAFDPLEVEERDPDDERIGGWGIPMLRTLTDELVYSRTDGENVLSLKRAERDS